MATTPFTVLVKMLPVTDWVKEFMKEIMFAAKPFMVDVKVFVVVEILFVVLLAIIFPIFPMFAFVIVALLKTAVFVAVIFPTIRVPPVAVSKKRFETYPVIDFNVLVKKLVLVAFTPTILLKIGLLVKL